MHLNNQYSRKLKNANRPRYKRELYELYLWERMNINNTFLRVRAALIKAALMKQLAGTFSPPGPSFLNVKKRDTRMMIPFKHF